MGYKLSSELLTFAKKNKSQNTIYHPKYGYIVKNSSTFQDIAYGTSTSGSSIFNKGPLKMDNDLYYAIKHFDYSKNSASSHTVLIEDIYDFSS